MNRSVLLAGLLVLLLGCAGRAPAPDAGLLDPDTEATLRAIKSAIVDGHRTRNRASLDSLYAEDYLAVNADGTTRTKADLLGNLDQGDEMLEGRYELRNIRRTGDIAIASGHGRMVYREGDSTSVAEYDSVNLFARRDGRWVYLGAYLP